MSKGRTVRDVCGGKINGTERVRGKKYGKLSELIWDSLDEEGFLFSSSLTIYILW